AAARAGSQLDGVHGACGRAASTAVGAGHADLYLFGGAFHMADAHVVAETTAGANPILLAELHADCRAWASRLEADVAASLRGLRSLQVEHVFAAAGARDGATAEAAAQGGFRLAQFLLLAFLCLFGGHAPLLGLLLPGELGLALAFGGRIFRRQPLL